MTTARGTIESRPVVAFCADSHLITEADSAALCSSFEDAVTSGVPIIGIRRSLHDGVPQAVAHLAAYGGLLDASIRCSGVVPQINVVAVLAGPAASVPPSETSW